MKYGESSRTTNTKEFYDLLDFIMSLDIGNTILFFFLVSFVFTLFAMYKVKIWNILKSELSCRKANHTKFNQKSFNSISHFFVVDTRSILLNRISMVVSLYRDMKNIDTHLKDIFTFIQLKIDEIENSFKASRVFFFDISNVNQYNVQLSDLIELSIDYVYKGSGIEFIIVCKNPDSKLGIETKKQITKSKKKSKNKNKITVSIMKKEIFISEIKRLSNETTEVLRR